MSEKRNRRASQPLSPSVEIAGGEMTMTSLARPQCPLPPLLDKWFVAVSKAWKWVLNRSTTQQKRRRLRVCESAQLGEKRFVALVQADGERFLIGGTANSISLLATLPKRQNFRSVLADATVEAIEK